MERMEDFLPKAKLALTILLAMLGLVVLRLGLDQAESYRIAIEAQSQGDHRRAVVSFERVLNAHIPFSPTERSASEMLKRIGTELENKGEPELALLCFETLRASRYLSRHVVMPGSADISFLNNKIAFLKTEFLVGQDKTLDRNRVYKNQMVILEKDFQPSILWSVGCVLFMGAFLVLGFCCALGKLKSTVPAAVCLAISLLALFNA